MCIFQKCRYFNTHALGQYNLLCSHILARHFFALDATLILISLRLDHAGRATLDTLDVCARVHVRVHSPRMQLLRVYAPPADIDP